MSRILLALVALVLAGWFFGGVGAVQRPPGMVAPDAPWQAPLDRAVPPMKHNGFTITPLARFALRARVLSREDYRFDTGAQIAPVDLALGWGRMSDSDVIDTLSISQGTRWWHWRSNDMRLSREEIDRSAANMHIIPANDAVAGALDAVRPGSVVELSGYLVETRRDRDGWHWRSSLSRTDSGQGACELIWVETLRAY